MTIDFDKIEPLCGNAYLIDETLCLKNSFPIINYNINSLSGCLLNLNVYSIEFNKLFSNFSANSSRWIAAINNWETLSALWLDAETVVKTISSYWFKQINLIYTEVLDLVTYYQNSNTYNTQIQTWLNQNFLNVFSENQYVSVDVSLYTNFYFDWSFFYSYYEGCVPPNTAAVGNCECPRPNHSCNAGYIDGVYFRGCRNAGSYCRQDNTLTVIGGLENVFCPNFGGGNNTIDYQKTSFDKVISRVISLRFRKINNTFQLA